MTCTKITKVNENVLLTAGREMVKLCQFCVKETNIKHTDIFEITIPGAERFICRHCLVKLYTQIGDALRPSVNQNPDREPLDGSALHGQKVNVENRNERPTP